MTQFKAPTQERSRATLTRLYETTNELMNEKDFSKITMAEISARAGVTIGSIYQRFGSKKDLLWWMYENYVGEAATIYDELFSAPKESVVETRAEALIRTLIRVWSPNKGVIRSLLLMYRQDREAIPVRFRETLEGAYEDSARFLLGDDVSEAESEKGVFAITLILSACREQILFHEEQWDTVKTINQDRFIALLVQAVTGVLRREANDHG